MIKLGKISFNNPVLLAPMSGVTDEPFRSSVKKFGDIFTKFMDEHGSKWFTILGILIVIIGIIIYLIFKSHV